MRPMSRRSWIARACALAASPILPIKLARAADFYDGKTLHFLVGIPPGGSYDLMPRFLAAHLAKYIPGTPKIVVENMPGAGSLLMMNYLYYKAPHDGTVIGFPMNTMLLEPSLGLVSGGSGGGTRFDLSRMAWIGTPGQDPSVAWVAGDSPVRSFEDLRTRGATFGTSNAGADGTVIANLCNKLLDTKIKIVSGYAGTAEYVAAFEKGEVEGAVTLYGALMAAHADWISSGRIRLLAQFGTERSPELPAVPTGVELATNDEAREMLRFYGTKFSASYPVVLPPDVPADQTKILREAFARTMQDADFKAKLESLHVSGGAVSPEAVEAFIAGIENAPPAVVQKLRAVLQAQ
jgi:tripartite-type tricarboxylate transporter receptor subunit TctC